MKGYKELSFMNFIGVAQQKSFRRNSNITTGGLRKIHEFVPKFSKILSASHTGDITNLREYLGCG